MSTQILENEYLRVTVADAGAELVSVYDKVRRAERIWTGDPAVWNRHAPILFPFVGKVTGGRYRIGDQEYAMETQHGFARDMAFSRVEATDESIAHCLTDSAWTRERYPYAFRLVIRHRLDGSRLRVEWTIENPGDRRMYFSIGGHPGFLLPEGARKEDCWILFPGLDAPRFIHSSKAGYALPEARTIVLDNGRVRYREDIPDTWIFEDGQVRRVGIATPDGRPFVMLECAQFPMLAVWANPRGPFICLEPWFGRTDDEGFAGTIDQKKGILALESGEKKEIAYAMEFMP